MSTQDLHSGLSGYLRQSDPDLVKQKAGTGRVCVCVKKKGSTTASATVSYQVHTDHEPQRRGPRFVQLE
jgi:hypothetical protein